MLITNVVTSTSLTFIYLAITCKLFCNKNVAVYRRQLSKAQYRVCNGYLRLKDQNRYVFKAGSSVDWRLSVPSSIPICNSSPFPNKWFCLPILFTSTVQVSLVLSSTKQSSRSAMFRLSIYEPGGTTRGSQASVPNAHPFEPSEHLFVTG